MDNINDILLELLETYSRSKDEINSILKIYEDKIKNRISLIDKCHYEESKKVIIELFNIQNEICLIIYKYDFPVSEFFKDFIYEFDRQDIENIQYLIEKKSSS